MGTYKELPEKLQKRSLINIKNKDDCCFICSYIRYINPQQKIQIGLKLKIKNYLLKYMKNEKILNFL